jgi:hypothetical protein
MTTPESWKPTDDDAWGSLHEVLDPLWDAGDTEAAARATLTVFERFPTHDGWGVLRVFSERLEEHEGYEALLVESVRRAPSRMAIFAIDTARRHYASAPLSEDDVTALLREIAGNVALPEEVREQASEALG